ncbi:hypothetical protein, partial [Sinorhizobium meliloti]|uniref:hypothetical protein n=1 Tax=Rhizobium meliloti TaxID=382 RepID=UPI001AED087B
VAAMSSSPSFRRHRTVRPDKNQKCRLAAATGTIPISHRDVNKTKVCRRFAYTDSEARKNRTLGLAKMQRSDSKLGKTAKSIRRDSGDSCHGVTLPVG